VPISLNGMVVEPQDLLSSNRMATQSRVSQRAPTGVNDRKAPATG